MKKPYQLFHTISAFLIAALFAFPGSLKSQNVLADIDQSERHVLDRMLILSGGGPELFHGAIYPYRRIDMVKIADVFANRNLSPEDAHAVWGIWDRNNEFLTPPQDDHTTYHYTDSTRTFMYALDSAGDTRYRFSRRPLWNTFYKTPAHLYEVDVEDFYLRVNPLVRIAVGRESEEGVTTFINQRGISLRGGVGRKVYFSTSIYDSQVRFPNYVNAYTDHTGVVPGAALYKDYSSALFDFTNGRDFLIANAYAGVDFGKYFGLQLGHHQHFIGDGIRSLFLSDFSTPFFSLKFNTRIWKLHYQNIFAELAADDFRSVSGMDQPIPKKFMAAHYLSFKPRNNISIGLFETVIFNREGHQFELQYLNPVILYRTVEGSIGSPDNIMLGLNARWDIKNTISLYGQFMLDDILIREILNGNIDWWGNKFGHQLGIKYINALGIDQLDVQAEWNQVRPYTYSHYDQNANYAHYNQALAHPLGANFNEYIGSVRYQVSPKLGFTSRLFLISKGEDALDSLSFGGDILVPNTLRPGDFGHTIAQGVTTDIVFWSTAITYEISSGLYVDLEYLYRTQESNISSSKTNLIQAGVRLNMQRREEAF